MFHLLSVAVLLTGRNITALWLLIIGSIQWCTRPLGCLDCVDSLYLTATGVETRHWMLELQWRHNERDGVSTHRLLGSLLNRLFGSRSKKKLKLRVTGLCEGNSPVTGGFPSWRASNTENISIWWHHHGLFPYIALPKWGLVKLYLHGWCAYFDRPTL